MAEWPVIGEPNAVDATIPDLDGKANTFSFDFHCPMCCQTHHMVFKRVSIPHKRKSFFDPNKELMATHVAECPSCKNLLFAGYYDPS